MWLLGWFGLLGCSYVADRMEDNLQADVERICKVATKVDEDSSIEPGKKFDKLLKRVAEQQLGPAGLALVEALKKAPPEARQKVVDEVLERNGIHDLNCPPLDDILSK